MHRRFYLRKHCIRQTKTQHITYSNTQLLQSTETSNAISISIRFWFTQGHVQEGKEPIARLIIDIMCIVFNNSNRTTEKGPENETSRDQHIGENYANFPSCSAYITQVQAKIRRFSVASSRLTSILLTIQHRDQDLCKTTDCILAAYGSEVTGLLQGTVLRQCMRLKRKLGKGRARSNSNWRATKARQVQVQFDAGRRFLYNSCTVQQYVGPICETVPSTLKRIIDLQS